MGLEPALRTEEVDQLLRETAIDIDIPESRDPSHERHADLYRSEPGWDQFFGAGRLAVREAVERVDASGAGIPPVVRIDSPRWLNLVDPLEQPELVLTGEVSALRAEGFDLVVEWVRGPGEGAVDWQILREEVDLVGMVEGELGRLDLAALWAEAPVAGEQLRLPGDQGLQERLAVLDPVLVTVRIRAVDDRGNVGRARKTIWLHHDEDALPGFPLDLGGSLEPGPQLVDVDGDGVYEVLQATGGGWLHLVDGAGEPLPGWPVAVGVHPDVDPAREGSHRGAPWADRIEPDSIRQGILKSPAIGDLDGDGRPEVVAATLSGEVHSFRVDGTPFWDDPLALDTSHCAEERFGRRVHLQCGFWGSPVLEDLDGDGLLDVIAAGMDGWLYAWSGARAPLPGFPVQLWEEGLSVEESRSVSTPAVGDLDGDGDPEIVVGSTQVTAAGDALAFAFDHQGQPLPGWPAPLTGLYAAALPIIASGMNMSAVLGDLDGDGASEVFARAVADSGRVLDVSGTPVLQPNPSPEGFGEDTNAADDLAVMLFSGAAFADLDQDGVLDLLSATGTFGFALGLLDWAQRYEHEHLWAAWSGVDGQQLPGFPRVANDVNIQHAPAVADIDGDGLPEMIAGSGGGLLQAFDAQGRVPEGWPKVTAGWALGSPTVGDIDGDGFLDVVVSTREGLLHAWRTTGPADQQVLWTGGHQGPRNTGDAADLPPLQAGPPPPTPVLETERPEPVVVSGGCAVGGGAGRSALWGLLLGLLLLGARRPTAATPR